MCVVSMVMEQWWPKPEPYEPQRHPLLPQNPPPNSVPWPLIQQDPKLAQQMLEVLKRLEAIDKRLGLVEQCKVAAPEKRKVKAKLRRIAKKAKRASDNGT